MDLSQRIAKLTSEQRAQLDARLRKRHNAPKTLSDLIGKRPSSEPCLLSFAQERLWFLEKLEGASATYNIYSASRFRGHLRVRCLEQALTEIVSRHESLRTTFPVLPPNHLPIQRIAEPSEFRLEVVDLSSKPEALVESAVQQLVNEFARQPMYLAKGPLFRARLLRITPGDHVLAVIMHHIISDGWTLEVFFRELYTLYADFLSGRKPSLPPLKIQFADFARWQRQHLQGEELKRHIDYWKERLAGELPILELPTDFPRPPEQTYRGADCERWIGAGLTEKIRRMSREAEASLFMTILAAFKALLHRYSGQPSIQVGSPVTSRNRIELEPLMGFFVNMLVLRTDFSGDPTVRELIRQVRQVTLEALAHQGLPFEKLVQELRPNRSLSHSPLFQVALMFEEAGHQFLQLPGLTSEPIPVSTATAKFELTLFVSEASKGLCFGLEYAADLFKAETADRLLTHLECLLECAVANPDFRISQLSFLPASERQQILVEWNRSSADYPTEKTVHALFAEHVARAPDAIAVEFERQRLTYHELDRRSEALAEVLRQKGVTVETHVGIYVERSIDMVVGVLGIMKAGGVYVPLDPGFPKDRLVFMAADASIQVLVTQARLAGELPEHRAQVVYIDKLTHSPPSRSGPTSSVSTADNLIYTLYTSGSTGRPKGVQISHRAVVNLLQSMRQTPGLRPEDIWLAVTTLSFDISGLELFLPLTTGARVVIAPREDALDASRLSKLIEKSGATVMQATPATWRMLIEAGWRGDQRLKVLCGGEAIDRGLADRLLNCCGQLWNMYGPTETTIWSTTERLMPGQPITIGRPIANTQVYILDDDFQPTPPGVIGELFIGGDGVARGYLNRPDLTLEKFVPNPFDASGSGRLYRTGDLARFRADGRIEFLGRADQQVKIRGFRIEIGEIETALATVKGVARAVVVVREDAPRGKGLVAYVVPKLPASTPPYTPDGSEGSSRLGPLALRTALRLTLPEYMVPAVFVLLEALPLTPNGKVDRKALPAPDQSIHLETRYEAPQGPTEQKLAGIMASLVQLPRVGRKDDFFNLGGHSMLAVTLFNEIEQALGKRVPLATLFRAPTIEHLAAVLDAETDQVRKLGSLVPVQAHGSKPRFFCVHGAGGNVLLYRDLARRLGTEYPFYGLQSQGLDRQSAPLTTIEEMAERYLGEIRALQPEGPYCLGGYCLGGTIAYEMAQQLRHDGHEVALLALFDTYNFVHVKETSFSRFLWQKSVFHFGNLARLSCQNLPGYLSSKLRVASEGELRSLWKALTVSLRRTRTSDGARSIEADVQGVNDAAAAAYLPKPYSGRLTVFKPKINYDFLPDPQMGWGDIVNGGLEIVELPVNPHAMLVEPFVKRLANELRRRVDRVAGKMQTAETRTAVLPS